MTVEKSYTYLKRGQVGLQVAFIYMFNISIYIYIRVVARGGLDRTQLLHECNAWKAGQMTKHQTVNLGGGRVE